MEFDLDRLKDFLYEANTNGYAGGVKKCDSSQRPGFEEIEYQNGEWYFRDSYCGLYFAPGQEIVYFYQPVWTMAYNGGMKPQYYGNYEFTEETIKFLREALLAMDKEKPFRGPEIFERDDWLYVSVVHGDIKDFLGNEKIYKGHKLVFEQNFMGGLIVK